MLPDAVGHHTGCPRILLGNNPLGQLAPATGTRVLRQYLAAEHRRKMSRDDIAQVSRIPFDLHCHIGA